MSTAERIPHRFDPLASYLAIPAVVGIHPPVVPPASTIPDTPILHLTKELHTPSPAKPRIRHFQRPHGTIALRIVNHQGLPLRPDNLQTAHDLCSVLTKYLSLHCTISSAHLAGCVYVFLRFGNFARHIKSRNLVQRIN